MLKKMLDVIAKCGIVLIASSNGELAQLGERMTGSHEVRGSIPLFSTMMFQGRCYRPFLFTDIRVRSVLFSRGVPRSRLPRTRSAVPPSIESETCRGHSSKGNREARAEEIYPRSPCIPSSA